MEGTDLLDYIHVENKHVMEKIANFMKVNVIFCNFQLLDDIENDHFYFFEIFGLIRCIMNFNIWTKNMNLKMHHIVVKYKLNVLSNSTNISNAKAILKI